MFGYITANIQELSKEQLARYRAMYCGVCVALKNRYGSIDRMVLSNDMTFLAVLLHSLYEPKEELSSLRCPVHPVKPRDFVSSPILDYAADMNLILAWYKVLDDIRDENSLKARAEKNALQKSFEQVQQRWPDKCRVVEACLQKTTELEKAGSQDPDALCRLTGLMLGEIFAYRHDLWEPRLRRIGYGIGCFIYLMDAYEDYQGDLQKGLFNPLRQLHEEEHYEDIVKDDLTMLIAEAAAAFEELPLEKDIDLLRNILYHGVWNRYHAMHQKEKEVQSNGE